MAGVGSSILHKNTNDQHKCNTLHCWRRLLGGMHTHGAETIQLLRVGNLTQRVERLAGGLLCISKERILSHTQAFCSISTRRSIGSIIHLAVC